MIIVLSITVGALLFILMAMAVLWPMPPGSRYSPYTYRVEHRDPDDRPKPDYRRIRELEVELGMGKPLDPFVPKERAEMVGLGLAIPADPHQFWPGCGKRTDECPQRIDIKRISDAAPRYGHGCGWKRLEMETQ